MSSRGKTATDADADADDATTTTNRRTETGDDGTRNHMTSIYYMLTRESDHQWWALNESDHVHYHHAGGAVAPAASLSAQPPATSSFFPGAGVGHASPQRTGLVASEAGE